MKRFFICAAAAIVALASCSKTEVINNEPQKEIGFKAITSVATKAEQTTANLGTMGVYAYLNEDKSEYFGNTQFAKGAGDLWVATPSKYWPLVHTLDFVVYAPYAATGTECNSSTKILTVAIQKLQTRLTSFMELSIMTTLTTRAMVKEMHTFLLTLSMLRLRLS